MTDEKFIARIKPGAACAYINIDDSESAIYSGAGLRLAHVVQGEIKAMFDPADLAYEPDADLAAGNAAQAAFAWANAQTGGSLWLGQCSCYQFCEPKQISLSNAAHVASVAHAIDKYLREMAA